MDLLNYYKEAQNLQEEQNKKILKIDFTDFYSGFNKQNNFFTRILEKKYILEFSPAPDIVFCSCFGSNFKKYKCKRIVFLGENITPNFNAYDYAFAFDFITFLDRYKRVPLYYYYLDKYFQNIENFIDKRNDTELINRKFCTFVVSNNIHSSTERYEFFKLLSEYKRVDSGGSAFNNIGGPVKDKHNFIKNYKFNICFENSKYPGYVTEKIMEAFLARTVPIYCGSPMVDADFNPKSFIDISKFNNFKEAKKYISFLDNNDVEYGKILSESPLNGGFYNNLNHKGILDFLINIIENGVIYHKDSLSFRDENGHYKKIPKYIKYISAFVPIKSKRRAIREKMLKRYIQKEK